MKLAKTTKLELTQSCLELAQEIASGPAFFDKFNEPTEAVQRYTGSRVTRDMDRCALAGALRLLSYSDRMIAKSVGCDVRSIPLMVERAEQAGLIPALKERLAALTARNAERAQIALGGLLERAANEGGDLDLAAMIKAVATAGGIQTEKFQLLTGGPTEILGLKVGDGRAEIEAWARSLALPIDAEVTSPTDSKSAGIPQNTSVSDGFDAAGAAHDTEERGKAPDARTDGTGGGAASAGAGRDGRRVHSV